MKINQNKQKTATLPYRVGDRVWVQPPKQEFAHRLILLMTPNKKLKTDFYIFLYKAKVEDEDNLLIIKTPYLNQFFFTPNREDMEKRLYAVGREKYEEILNGDLAQKLTVSNTDENFMAVVADLPPKESAVGIMPEEERQKAERKAKHPKTLKDQAAEQAEPNADEILTTVPDTQVTAEITEEPNFTVNKGE